MAMKKIKYEGDPFFMNAPPELRKYYVRVNGEWILTKKGEERKLELESKK